MFIICPKCGAKYQIPEGTTLENGQKLKCSACGHLFAKGEESPLVLDKLATPESAPDAFSKPLYTMDDAAEKPASPIPEVFQPVPESAPKKSGLWIIPIYIILLVALCIAGWHFRDLLKPSFSEIIPDPVIQPNPVITETVKQVDPIPAITEQPTIIPQEGISEKSEPVSEPTPIPQPIVKPAIQPEESPVLEPELPKGPKITGDEPTSLILSTDTDLEFESDSEIEPVDDNLPLFEIEPAPKKATEITDVSYKIEPDEAGIPQLLVNGSLKNLKPEIQSAPKLTLFVYDDQDRLLAQKEIHLTSEILAPSDVVSFYTGLTPAPLTTARVEVR